MKMKNTRLATPRFNSGKLIHLMAVVLAAAMALVSPWLAAQSPEPLDHPNLSISSDGWIYTVAAQPDGGIILGGSFTRIGKAARNNIARLRPDGSLDPDWKPELPTWTVLALAVAADGTIYVGGNRSTQPNINRALLKLSPAGVLDETWNPDVSTADGTGRNATIQALQLNGQGEIFVAGSFTQINGTARSGIAKLSVAGSGAVDASWVPPTFDKSPVLLALDGDALFVGGTFTQIGGQARNRLAKLSATGSGGLDSQWAPTLGGAYPNVSALAARAGAVFIGGYWETVNGVARPSIVKLSGMGTGSVDTAWNPSVPFSGGIRLVLSNQHVYASSSSVIPRRYALSGTGALDPSWAPTAYGAVHAVTPNGTVVAAGGGTSHDGRATVSLLSTSNGATRSSHFAGIQGKINAVTVQPDGSIIVGGLFSSVEGVKRNNVFRVRPNGSFDAAWAPAVPNNVEVYTLAASDAGQVYVGGAVNSYYEGYLRRFSGTGIGAIDQAWNAALADAHSLALAIGKDGAVYTAGYFSTIGGQPRSGIAKLSASGSGAVDVAWSPSMNGLSEWLAIAPDGGILVGGDFTSVGGVARAGLAKLDAATGQVIPSWTPPSLPNYVADMKVGADGYLYLTGAFDQVGGQMRRGIARLDAGGTGTLDALWSSNSEYLSGSAIALDGAGVAYVAGSASSGHAIRKYTLEAGGVRDTAWDPAPDNTVSGLTTTPGGNLVVIGQFSRIGGRSRDGFALLPPTQAWIFKSGFEASEE